MTSSLNPGLANPLALPPARFNILGQMQVGPNHFLLPNSSFEESPLDFSTTKSKKFKVEKGSPFSLLGEADGNKLRAILKMKSKSKSPTLQVLNLTKDSPPTSPSCHSSSASSTMLSPSMEEESMNMRALSPDVDGRSQREHSGNKNSQSSSSPSPPQAVPSGLFAGHYALGAFSPWESSTTRPNFPPLDLVSMAMEQQQQQFLRHPHLQQQQHQQYLYAVPQSQSQLPNRQREGPQQHQTIPHSSPNGGHAVGTKVTKMTRPFKAYPKDPLTFSAVGMYGLPVGSAAPAEALLQQQSQQAYAEFRKQMLNTSDVTRTRRNSSIKGEPILPHQLMDEGLSFSRITIDTPPSQDVEPCAKSPRMPGLKGEQNCKDEAYWERRRKNNEAAKRSRDARRAKEDEIAIRAAFLEQENLKLRFEVCALKNEAAKLRCMLYTTS